MSSVLLHFYVYYSVSYNLLLLYTISQTHTLEIITPLTPPQTQPPRTSRGPHLRLVSCTSLKLKMPRSLLRNAAGAARFIASTSSERVNSCTGNIRLIGYRRETINVSGSSHSDPLFHRYCRNLSSGRDYYNILQKSAKIHRRKISLQRKNHVSLCRFFSAVSSNSDDEDRDDEGEEEEEDDGLEYLTDISPGVKSKIRAMKARHDEIIAQMQDFDNINGGGSHNPGGGGDATSLGKELSSLSAVSYLCERAAEIHTERVSLLELLAETKSAGGEEASEMEEEIRQELVDLDEQSTALSHKFLHSLVPLINPDDVQDLTASDAVIDIRAGTGGDEACLFAAELMAGYEAAAKAGGGDDSGFGAKSWEVEVLSVSRTDLGGIKEASLVVSSSKGGGGGYNSFDSHQQEDIPQNDEELTNHLLSQLGPYGFFRFESGVHRVQRVPVNDVKMQTSAVSVAIMPSLPDHALPTALPPNELKIVSED